jgi:hypothetical protein
MLPKTDRAFAVLALLAGTWAAAVPLPARAADKVVAYVVTAGTAGNQEFGGVLGMDFDVANPIVVTQIGVFDDNSDGLQLPITAKLWDRSDPASPVVLETVEFTPEEPGTLVGGSRFKPLPAPRRLEIGFRGTIGAEGYGAGERLRNTLGVIANRNWTVNDGNGSIQFVGGGRYGTVNGEYPGTVDGGPADRYCAGTFEFETTPPLKPGPPAGLTIDPAATTLSLAWLPVTTPLPAAKYEIFRATSPTGEFARIGEVTGTNYVDATVAAGQTYCYQVRGLGQAGQVGVDSARICATPYELAAGQRLAYAVQAGIAGTQAFDGPLGMDFDVANAVVVTHLGIFDDGSDGLNRTVTARLWDRSNPEAPVEMANLEFTPGSPGTAVRGSRFKPLPSPIRLEPGFRGTISAENYGAEERVYNPGPSLTVVRPWTVDSGSGSLVFLGTGRYGTVAAEFPGTPDVGVPDRYGAGTFQYQLTSLVNPGIPKVTLGRGDGVLTLAWDEVTEPAPAARYRILRGPVDADLTQVAEVADLAYTDTSVTKGTEYCYSVVAVTAAGQAGLASPRSCLTAEAREPGAAYVVEAGTVGSQAFGGALGMDFDVLRPIRVTRLGVFDDSSDGLFLPISARLYDRATREVIASLDFTPEAAGDLIGGSRFLTLPQPVTLPAGFQGTMVASGYGGDERNGNGVAGRSVFTGGGSIAFVGSARYGVAPADFPGTPDGGPANRYAAGTFYFEPAAEPPTLAIARSGTKLRITWTGGGGLESASAVVGPWAQVPGAASGIEIEPVGAGGYYRVRQ